MRRIARSIAGDSDMTARSEAAGIAMRTVSSRAMTVAVRP
jgi:hypothetical protein